MIEVLNTLYEFNISKINILQRKVSIDNNFTLLFGTPKCGKTYLIYDYLQQFENEEYLYIDINDIRINKNEIFLNLNSFINEKNISVLALDNFDFSFDISSLENLTSIVISTTNCEVLVPKFNKIHLLPLDFEEFILFDNKHQNTINSFNYFLKHGNLPEIIQYSDLNKLQRNQEVLKLITTNEIEFEILKLIVKNSGEIKSILQLFTILKKNHKISKDFFYSTCKKFEINNIIYFCQKYKSTKSPKKIFCFNHSFIDAVNINKNFNNLFSNMVFLELKKFYQNIYYLDNIDFYIKEKNSIILTIPFFNNYISISKKILPILVEYNISSITIVTISTNDTIFIGDIEYEVIPFYEWSLGL